MSQTSRMISMTDVRCRGEDAVVERVVVGGVITQSTSEMKGKVKQKSRSRDKMLL